MSIFGPEKTREASSVEQRLLKLERKKHDGLSKDDIEFINRSFYELERDQSKTGKRYRGGCLGNVEDEYNLFTELTSITFMGGDFLGMFDRLSLYFINERSGLGSYRVFTRTTQSGAVKYLQDINENVNLFSLSLIALSPVITINENVFIESWVWIDYQIGGYALELTLYGRLEEEPKCYHYNINYLKH